MSRSSDGRQTHEAVPRRTEETKLDPPTQEEPEFQAPAEPKQHGADAREPEERQVEEEHRKALEEEAMEQVGQAERLEEQDREWKDQREPREEADLGGHAPAAGVRGPLLLVHQGGGLWAGTGGVASFLKIEKASPSMTIPKRKSE